MVRMCAAVARPKAARGSKHGMEPSVSLHDLRAVYDPEMHVAMLRDGSRHRFYGQCLLMHPELKGQAGPSLDRNPKFWLSPSLCHR